MQYLHQLGKIQHTRKDNCFHGYRTSRAIGFLTYAHSFLPIETVIALYRGIIEPHFRYCFSVCGCAGKTEVNQLQ